jgi:hypothetical protein
MRWAVSTFALLVLFTQTGNAASTLDMTLVLPRTLRAGEIALINVQVGPISRGQQINITTASGQELGVISPFGVRRAQDAGTYTLPVPRNVVHDGRISIRLTITQPGAAPRAPTAQEVRGVKLIVNELSQ